MKIGRIKWKSLKDRVKIILLFEIFIVENKNRKS